MSANCTGFREVTVSTDAVSIGGLPDFTKGVTISVETDEVRWRADGTDPESDAGHRLVEGSQLIFDSWTAPTTNWKSTLKALRFIKSGTADAKLMIHFWD